MKKYYKGLFEDEIAELLRELEDNAYIVTGLHFETAYIKIHTLYEDGIISTVNDYYIHYINGKQCGFVGIGSVINSLAHNEFYIETI